MKQEKIIYTKKLAYKLRMKGFKIIRVGVNENYPQYDTYVFEDTPALQEALTELSAG